MYTMTVAESEMAVQEKMALNTGSDLDSLIHSLGE